MVLNVSQILDPSRDAGTYVSHKRDHPSPLSPYPLILLYLILRLDHLGPFTSPSARPPLLRTGIPASTVDTKRDNDFACSRP